MKPSNETAKASGDGRKSKRVESVASFKPGEDNECAKEEEVINCVTHCW